MRRLAIAAGLGLTVLTAGVSAAQPARAESCERSKSNDRVTGTLLGGLVGGLAGSAIGGDALGGIVGAGVGAVGGNVIAGRRAGPCPSEYYARGYVPRGYAREARRDYRRALERRRYADERREYRSTASSAGYNRCGWQDQTYRDAYGNVVRRQVQVCR